MKDLIEKYFAGETSLEEDAQIVEYFNSGKVVDEFKQYIPLFYFIKREQKAALGDDFDEKLLQRIEQPARAKLSIRSFIFPALKIAAIGVVLIAVYLLLRPTPAATEQHAINWEKYEIKDEQAALEETVKALRLVSFKLKKGSGKTMEEVSKTEPLSKYLN